MQKHRISLRQFVKLKMSAAVVSIVTSPKSTTAPPLASGRAWLVQSPLVNYLTECIFWTTKSGAAMVLLVCTDAKFQRKQLIVANMNGERFRGANLLFDEARRPLAIIDWQSIASIRDVPVRLKSRRGRRLGQG
jgi:hypothetical protein